MEFVSVVSLVIHDCAPYFKVFLAVLFHSLPFFATQVSGSDKGILKFVISCKSQYENRSGRAI